MIKKSINKNIDHIYCNNIEFIQDTFSMLTLDVFMSSNNKLFNTTNLNELLNDYIQFLNQHFLYLNCQFFNEIFSLKTVHHRIIASKHFHTQLTKAHEKYVAYSNYKKENLIQDAVNKINTYNQLAYGNVH